MRRTNCGLREKVGVDRTLLDRFAAFLSPQGTPRLWTGNLICSPRPLWGRGWTATGVFISRRGTGEGVKIVVHGTTLTQGVRGCKKILECAKAFYAKGQVAEGAKRTRESFFASLCALASLREMVYFFTASFNLVLTPSPPRPAKRGAPSALRSPLSPKGAREEELFVLVSYSRAGASAVTD